MNLILVLNTSADFGGGDSVLKDFIDQTRLFSDYEFDFVLSKHYDGIAGEQFIYPWVKNSWFHRLYFDKFVLPRIIKRKEYSSIYSMQNVLPGWTRTLDTTKIVLIHQSIQFYDDDIPLFSVEGIKLNIRKWLIGKLITNNIRNVDFVFVQSRWMKKRIEHVSSIDTEKICLVSTINLSKKSNELVSSILETYFYPAGSSLLKNHWMLIKTWKVLKEKHGLEPKLVLTIDRHDNKTTKSISDYILKFNLNVELIGYINKEELGKLYKESILVFSSLIETFALPLYEAKSYNSIVFSLNKDYAVEALENYPNGYLFNDVDSLIQLLLSINIGTIVQKESELIFPIYPQSSNQLISILEERR
jgi:glycosyltransferase involved in cell wall biosynthesis